MIRDRLSSESCGTIDRIQAATLLQEARNAEGSVANDAIDRAFAQLPESPGARILKIKQLINQDDLDEAGAVIAQGLLQRPTNASLTLLRAQVLYAQGKYDDCANELRLLLLKRPKHFASLVLAGQIAIANDAPLRAASYFMRASSRPLSNRETLKLLANALNEAGQVREARLVLDRIKPRPLFRFYHPTRGVWAMSAAVAATWRTRSNRPFLSGSGAPRFHVIGTFSRAACG